MKTSTKMARTIAELAERFGIALDTLGNYARIDNPPYLPLSIDVQCPYLVRVAHFGTQNGDLMADPAMTFFTGYGVENGWVPVDIQHDYVGVFRLASRVEDGTITEFFEREQDAQARFADQWAQNLRDQGFLQGSTARHGE